MPESAENKREDPNMEVSAPEVQKLRAAAMLADIRRLQFGKRSTTKTQVRKSSLVSIAAGMESADPCTSKGNKLRSSNQGELLTKGTEY